MPLRTPALLLLVAAAGCTLDPPPSLRVGTLLWPGYEPLYQARDRGDWTDQQVQLVEYLSSTQVLRAFRNGAIDGATLTLDEAMVLDETGYPLEVVLLLDASNGADAVLARPPLKSLAELRGKRVGVENTAMGAYVLLRALSQAGIQASELQIVPVPANEHVRAYESGTVDAVVTFEPMLAELRKKGANVVADSRSTPGEIVDALVVRKAFAEAHPEQVGALQRGWSREVGRFIAREPAALAAAARRMGVEQASLAASLDELELMDCAANAARLPRLPETAERLAAQMRGGGMLRKDFQVSSLVGPRTVTCPSAF